MDGENSYAMAQREWNTIEEVENYNVVIQKKYKKKIPGKNIDA